MATLQRISKRDALLKTAPMRSCYKLYVPTPQLPFTGFELMFLGTGAGSPSVRRNPAGVCLRLTRSNWMFDCGEGSLRQLIKSTVRVPLTTKFFISHLHGDHLYGLPGILCTLDNHNAEYKDPLTKVKVSRPIDVYGPLGLFSYLNTAFSTSSTRLSNLKITVHELVCPHMLDKTSAHEKFMRNAPKHANLTRKWVRAKPGVNGDVWNVLDDGMYTVKAAVLKHTVTSFGYVVEEYPIPGKLNLDALRKRGLPPGPKYRALKLGKSVKLPNGDILHASEVVGQKARGRKVAILGDSSDSSRLFDIAQNCDVLVHEATLSHKMVKQAVHRGHSTARMAGYAAKKMNATLLALTHFSHRFRHWSIETNARTTLHLTMEAQEMFGRRAIIPATDFLRISIPRHPHSSFATT
ncbi:ribonuclease z [Plasmopara halstedii]|uniref:Ribonuclease z n=1 Tax=Plasmopara halstedii TaxID=4781 RepID=A0A0N7L4C9_PLAHL|nr:ribonuclease z [Plasmopara halstedii]CEG38323.1 ribonuclease z [Plasmopara halstedii]|eukprot:XP_024574692.1 ribonuclease z [Plasmopara halstedii]